MSMSVHTAGLLRIIKLDAEAIATQQIMGGSAVVVAGRIKDCVDALVAAAAKDAMETAS
jgi:hypothetical protein